MLISIKKILSFFFIMFLFFFDIITAWFFDFPALQFLAVYYIISLFTHASPVILSFSLFLIGLESFFTHTRIGLPLLLLLPLTLLTLVAHTKINVSRPVMYAFLVGYLLLYWFGILPLIQVFLAPSLYTLGAIAANLLVMKLIIEI